MTKKVAVKSTRTHQGRTPKLETVLKKGLRILNEHMARHEDLMFTPGPDGVLPKWNGNLAKAGEDLCKSANAISGMYLKIQSNNKQMAEMMSVEEKVEAFLNWAKALGRSQWYELLRGFREIEFDKNKQYRPNQRGDAPAGKPR